MKPEELRIGNFIGNKYYPERVYTYIGYYSKVGVEFEYMGGTGFFSEKDLIPIPLDEDWLIKFGFNITHMATGISVNAYISKVFSNRFIDIHYDGYYLYQEKTPIEFVHQLQNLFYSLSGEELTIK